MNANETEYDLIGYLLDALDGDDREALEARLASDPKLQQSMQKLRQALYPLRADSDHLAPPLGLAERTIRYVERRGAAAKPRVEPPVGRTTWRWVDLAVAATVLFVASMLFFPSVMKGRFEQQVAYCSENLRQLGTGLWQYSENHDGYFPYVPAQGNYAAAGIFGPTLHRAGLLPEVQTLLCPSSPQAKADTALVSLEKLDKAQGPQLAQLRNQMGGSYGYALGYEKDGRYYGNKNRSRARFALLADSPSSKDGARYSLNHDGRGQNVLYEDGHVQFQRTATASGCQDDIFHNDLGIIGAGQHVNDAVVAPSGARPVRLIHLRLYYVVPPGTKFQLPPGKTPGTVEIPGLLEIDGLK
jgi:hypothetical protein